MELKKIESQLMKLDLQARSYLVDRLVESLWIDEAKRRLRDLDAGRTKAIPLAKVLKSIRSRLK